MEMLALCFFQPVVAVVNHTEQDYLNFAETRSKKPRPTIHPSPPPASSLQRRHVSTRVRKKERKKQAVRSLGPLGCACYQASTGGLST
ncbi:MAG TPA: hypothetical protein VEU97_08100, partial [Ktedonobacteraceae bacterium]|nr:hypothetical protein [Ktedonobacteraceae bacterium]